MKNQFYIAVAPSPAPTKIEVTAPENAATTTSIWALVGAVIISSVPHLWRLLSGQQSAQTALTTTLLKNLNDSYQLSSVSNETFRSILNSVAERPTALAESNAERLRDLQQEVADLKGEVLTLKQKIDSMAGIVTRQAQK